MYFIGMLEKILYKPEVKEVEIKPPKTAIFEKNENNFKYKNNQFSEDKKSTFPKKEFKPYEKKYSSDYVKKEFKPYEKKEKSENCYGLFALDGHSFNAMYNNQKVVLKLNNVWTPENNQPFHKDAKNFLDSKIKKKVVYLTVSEKNEESNYIVEIFEDKEKSISINKQLIDLGYSADNKESFQKKDNTDDQFTGDDSYFDDQDEVVSIKLPSPPKIEEQKPVIPSERVKSLKFPK